MPSIEAQIRAVQALRRAAMGLSVACIEELRVPEAAVPLAGFYDRTLLQQEPSPEITALLGKLL